MVPHGHGTPCYQSRTSYSTITRGNRCTLRLMRRTVALHCCLAFVTAFILAPFQHVHRDGDRHDHVPIVHSHLYQHHHDRPHMDKPGEREIESADEDQVSSLDTFTLVLQADFSPFIPSRAPSALSSLRRKARAVSTSSKNAGTIRLPREIRLPGNRLPDLPLEQP